MSDHAPLPRVETCRWCTDFLGQSDAVMWQLARDTALPSVQRIANVRGGTQESDLTS
ncbi:MAG: hypothetical protein AB7F79_09125 [Steroidobacteraceae bacterium]